MNVTIKPSQVRAESASLKKVSKSLSRIKSEIDTANRNLKSEQIGRVFQNLNLAMTSFSVLEESQAVSSMSLALDQIVQVYNKTEKDISSYESLSHKIDRILKDLLNRYKDPRFQEYIKSLFPGKDCKIMPLPYGLLSPSLKPLIDSYRKGEIDFKHSALNFDSNFHAQVDKNGVRAEAGFDASLYNAQFGYHSGDTSFDAELTVGAVAATGVVTASFYKDGKFDPNMEISAHAEAKGVEAKAKFVKGNDKFNVHGDAKGTVGYASADAKVKVSKDGVQVKAGAEAYIVKGEIKGGFKIFGVQFDVGLEGKAGGAGVTYENNIGKDSVSGKVSAGLLAGLGVNYNIDFSGAKIPNGVAKLLKIPTSGSAGKTSYKELYKSEW